jgi:acetate kinase
MSSPETVPRRSRTGGAASCIAVVNAGSSSIKFGVYQADDGQPMLFRGKIEGIGVAPRLRVADAGGTTVAEHSWKADELDQRSATREVLFTARDLLHGTKIDGVGHRVVHGGSAFACPTRVDAEVMAALEKLTPLAPLHEPYNLAAIAAIAEAAPQVPQVACFDTAFHRSQPPVAELFGLPRELTAEGVRRYGFHGLSYEYIAGRLKTVAPELAAGRVIVAHLGSGASLCALQAGRSIATTMGFTGLDGLVMGTRCGSLDPGVLLYLMDTHGMGARQIEELVYRRSGLLGVSGISPDMRVLRASQESGATEAIRLFVYRVVREIGSLAAALGGLDGLVFTAGVLDEDRNRRGGEGRIDADGSRVQAWVLPTDEEAMIARHTAAVLAGEQANPPDRIVL